MLDKPLHWIGIAQNILNDNIQLNQIGKLKSKYLYKPHLAHIQFTMHQRRKKDLTNEEAKRNFLQMLSKYDRHIPVFTDGSLKPPKAGCAVIIQGRSYVYKLPDNTSIFTAEIFAISMAIDRINRNQNTHFLMLHLRD